MGPPHFLAELKAGDDGKFWSAIWEAMLYRHLKACGFNLRNKTAASGQIGPDFGFDHDGRTIWIEAVVPSPEGIPAEWLEPWCKGIFGGRPWPCMQFRRRR
jgi:hypothetical protein